MTRHGQAAAAPGGALREILKGFVAGLVIAMIAVTGQLVAAEKGRSDPGLAGLLCLSGSLVMVELGDDGTPEGPGHVCPDALLAAIAGPSPEPSFGGWTLVFDHGAPVERADVGLTASADGPPPARAPPAPV